MTRPDGPSSSDIEDHRLAGIVRRTVPAFVLATAALTACGGDAPASEGQALYESNCAACHGERALGDGPLAATLPVEPPSLMEHLGHHPMAQLVSIIQTGVPPAMPPAPLDEAQVRLVIDYAWTLVPDSLVEELREMQRMAEMGMEMNMGGTTGDSSGMDGMDHSGHDMGGMPMGGVQARPDSSGS